MRNFRMFFGIAVGVILLLFVARIAIVAFIVAAILSLVYAVYRRIRDFITYDRYGQPYHRGGFRHARMDSFRNHGMESFYNEWNRRGTTSQPIQVVEIK